MPNVTFYLNRSTGFWFANVYWPDTQERKRYSLRTRSETQARGLYTEFLKMVGPPEEVEAQDSCPPNAGVARVPRDHRGAFPLHR